MNFFTGIKIDKRVNETDFFGTSTDQFKFCDYLTLIARSVIVIKRGKYVGTFQTDQFIDLQYFVAKTKEKSSIFIFANLHSDMTVEGDKCDSFSFTLDFADLQIELDGFRIYLRDGIVGIGIDRMISGAQMPEELDALRKKFKRLRKRLLRSHRIPRWAINRVVFNLLAVDS